MFIYLIFFQAFYIIRGRKERREHDLSLIVAYLRRRIRLTGPGTQLPSIKAPSAGTTRGNEIGAGEMTRKPSFRTAVR